MGGNEEARTQCLQIHVVFPYLPHLKTLFIETENVLNDFELQRTDREGTNNK